MSKKVSTPNSFKLIIVWLCQRERRGEQRDPPPILETISREKKRRNFIAVPLSQLTLGSSLSVAGRKIDRPTNVHLSSAGWLKAKRRFATVGPRSRGKEIWNTTFQTFYFRPRRNGHAAPGLPAPEISNFKSKVRCTRLNLTLCRLRRFRPVRHFSRNFTRLAATCSSWRSNSRQIKFDEKI